MASVSAQSPEQPAVSDGGMESDGGMGAMLALLGQADVATRRLENAGVADDLVDAYSLFIRPVVIHMLDAANDLARRLTGEGATVADLLATHSDVCRTMMGALALVMEHVSRFEPQQLRRLPRRSPRLTQRTPT